MRRTVTISAIFLALLSILCFAFCRNHFKATPPSRLETRVMTFAKHKALIGSEAQRNPVTVSARTIADGKEAFTHYCVACHGLDGQNSGVPFADRMSPPVPSLASPDVQGYSDGQLKWVIDYGIWPSGMPGSKGILSDDEIWSIVVYLRNLPPAGSLGEPEMYSH
jgi:mono/diheme cytochrome c family protein